MNANQMTTKIVFPAEGTTTRALRANMGLQPVGIMSGHMGLQVVGSRESYNNKLVVQIIKEWPSIPRGQAEHLYFLRGSPL